MFNEPCTYQMQARLTLRILAMFACIGLLRMQPTRACRCLSISAMIIIALNCLHEFDMREAWFRVGDGGRHHHKARLWAVSSITWDEGNERKDVKWCRSTDIVDMMREPEEIWSDNCDLAPFDMQVSNKNAGTSNAFSTPSHGHKRMISFRSVRLSILITIFLWYETMLMRCMLGSSVIQKKANTFLDDHIFSQEYTWNWKALSPT